MTFDEIIAKANAGNADAQFELGYFGAQRDHFNEALEWYKKSANQGTAGIFSFFI